jgi:hypothetical protein
VSKAENIEWLTEQVGRILAAAMDRAARTVTDVLQEVSDRCGTTGVYSICCALASVVHTLAFPTLRRGDGSLTGQMLAITKVPGAKPGLPGSLWAAQFVVAFVNGDTDNTTALFNATLADPDQHADGVFALIAMVADIARHSQADR